MTTPKATTTVADPWGAELTEYHRSIYEDPSIGADNPGTGFDDYLATSRRLGSWVAEEARARGFDYLAVRPVARNVAAVRRFHAAGFRTLGGHIDLTMDLSPRRHEWLHGASLHGLDFDY